MQIILFILCILVNFGLRQLKSEIHERLLEGTGGGDRLGGAREDGEETVAFAAALDQGAGVLRDDRRRERVVPREGEAHRFGVLLPETRAPLDVREQERHRAARQEVGLGHRGLHILAAAFTPRKGLSSWVPSVFSVASDLWLIRFIRPSFGKRRD